MNFRETVVLQILVLLAFFASIGCGTSGTYTVEVEEEKDGPHAVDLLTDDNLRNKHPEYHLDLVDSRPVEDWYGELWEINASAAVIGLDIPGVREREEGYLLELYPSYADAAKALAKQQLVLLPSINMLDGKAKQFDDGLYAELDAAMSFGKMGGFNDTSALLTAILEQLDPRSEAYAWIWGGLEIGAEGFAAGRQAPRPQRARQFVDSFENSEIEPKPIGFYTWSEELERTFRMLRYFQHGWESLSGVPEEIARIFESEPELLRQYRTVLDFYSHLTNPFDALCFADLTGKDAAGKSIEELWAQRGLARKPGGPTVHFLPCSTSRETVLFNKLFPEGLPAGTDLMAEFVKAIRDGRVDLAPGKHSGWYDYQVYALETFLLPECGKEHDKLLLTRKYKERMLQAFKALVTKRRETHVRQVSMSKGEAAAEEPPEPFLAPRLRLEPNPTYYLRTARSYAFLQAYLEAVVPVSVSRRLTGRRKGGNRGIALMEELGYMRNLFYGLHLVSCEDIGMRPDLLEGELGEVSGGPAECMIVAREWLQTFAGDPDLDQDTRVSVPIYVDPVNQATTLWCTLGIRGAKLRAWYANAPQWRPFSGTSGDGQAGTWESPDPEFLADASYVLLVDEFAEVTMGGFRTLTREQFRGVCDEHRTKDEIVEALSGD